ncbi:hypothetical protein SAICODRAFT_30261 [Saitoella complicata NRRL Y-17804]|uniref:Inhibitor I9 domain-containing protein n=1 Tax=Saitoella complicata (strain BCRC 22490 / CBS 7301 / JCM 7358 / NBRC 10748 / NRRL Y-17804) TaxID=698492 RepID=A0A0E9N927_SAICN|nr:uncharacterized protein SAICODRAFT_30261 [Saitoella complicata NRRL Y-17804]ODQ53208.1 hypothetical protein SAICODRAFT_30261 [Saitoella complicata NRRL Y-17804]GAO46334.1 hypothetical protein G7K_0566-t1 [Saitoella complicata NRRL Y-17804]
MNIKSLFTVLIVLVVGIVGAFAEAAPMGSLKQETKAFIVRYASNTPEKVIDAAIENIKSIGGELTHRYTLFKGFSAVAPVDAIYALKAEESPFLQDIEEDQLVTIADQPKLEDTRW